MICEFCCLRPFRGFGVGRCVLWGTFCFSLWSSWAARLNRLLILGSWVLSVWKRIKWIMTSASPAFEPVAVAWGRIYMIVMLSTCATSSGSVYEYTTVKLPLNIPPPCSSQWVNKVMCREIPHLFVQYNNDAFRKQTVVDNMYRALLPQLTNCNQGHMWCSLDVLLRPVQHNMKPFVFVRYEQFDYPQRSPNTILSVLRSIR